MVSRFFRAAGLALAASVLAVAPFAQAAPAPFAIQWDTNASLVRVVGPIPATLQNNEPAQLQRLFTVAVEPANALSSIGLPPIAGKYTVRSNYVEFKPLYPFEPGLAYRASFTPGKISEVMRLPRPELPRTTRVAQVYPSTDRIPQNLLKFYLHFSAPMSAGHIYEHIHLYDQDDAEVELPFLEIDEELWNPEMTRLTLFLDPGRIKREVLPLEEVGPALVPNKTYTLTIDDDWRDARGAPLKSSFEKRFQVVSPDRDPPDPSAWKITVPKANTRDPVAITFTDPLDQALALRLISLNSVSGQISLDQNETRWHFTPDQPWKPGQYKISVQSTIEDLAGNNIGKPFEVDLREGNRPRAPAQSITLPFNVD